MIVAFAPSPAIGEPLDERIRAARRMLEACQICDVLALLDGVSETDQDVAAIGPETALELASIRKSLANLRSFPALKEREGDGLLALHGLHFDIASGQLLALGDDDHFVAVSED